MATLKEVYDLLKEKQKNGENIGMFGESYIDMIENENKKEDKKTKEIDVTFQKNKNENQNTYQSTQDPVEQKKQSE
jgi:hypothetical protein